MEIMSGKYEGDRGEIVSVSPMTAQIRLKWGRCTNLLHDRLRVLDVVERLAELDPT